MTSRWIAIPLQIGVDILAGIRGSGINYHTAVVRVFVLQAVCKISTAPVPGLVESFHVYELPLLRRFHIQESAYGGDRVWFS